MHVLVIELYNLGSIQDPCFLQAVSYMQYVCYVFVLIVCIGCVGG